MKIVDRIHKGRPARFVTVTCSNQTVRELGYFTDVYAKEDIPRLDRAMLISMECQLELDGLVEVQ